MNLKRFEKQSGLIAALFTPIFLGMNPVFGKIALHNGADPFTVAAVRTVLAAVLLWVVYRLFARQYLYIYPLGLMNCVAIGSVNGIGSLMYYNGLSLLSASTAQLINALYLVFVMILTRISGQQLSWRIILRTGIAMLGILLIAGGVAGETNWLGIGLMMGNALLFGGTVVMSQRALYDMPAQTVAFYVLTTMAVVVAVARLAYNLPLFPVAPTSGDIDAWWAILGLAATTALSRLTMFIGVKGLGSVRTTLLVILE
ncbi:MAG: DMT family transporter, partial [Anaerolineae bacterium]